MLLSSFKDVLENKGSLKQKPAIPLWQTKLNISLDWFDKGLSEPNKLTHLDL